MTTERWRHYRRAFKPHTSPHSYTHMSKWCAYLVCRGLTDINAGDASRIVFDVITPREECRYVSVSLSLRWCSKNDKLVTSSLSARAAITGGRLVLRDTERTLSSRLTRINPPSLSLSLSLSLCVCDLDWLRRHVIYMQTIVIIITYVQTYCCSHTFCVCVCVRACVRASVCALNCYILPFRIGLLYWMNLNYIINLKQNEAESACAESTHKGVN